MTSITSADIGFILGVLGVLSIIFTVYNSFHKPQEDLETKQALSEKDLGTKATILAQKELEAKALVLAEQVKNKDIENERRFNEMIVRLDSAMAMAQNHIHTVDTKVDKLIEGVGSLANQVTKLATIIEERNPRK